MGSGRRSAVFSAVGMMLALLLTASCQRQQALQWQGYVEGEFVYVASGEAGRLEQLTVQRGQQVAARAPLFRLEAVRETAAYQQAEQQLAAASAQLEDLKLGRRAPELDVIRAQLRQAQAAAQLADERRHRDEAQFSDGVIAQAQLDASRADAESASARIKELRSQLAVAQLPGREQQLAAQTAQVDAARAQLQQADWVLQQKAVTATQAGLVYDTLYRVGEWVPAGSAVVRMLPPQNLKIRFFVAQPQLGALRVGDAVQLHCDGCARELTAQIRYISAQAEYTPPVIYSNETRDKLVFMVEAWPAAEDVALLHPGQPLQVRRQ